MTPAEEGLLIAHRKAESEFDDQYLWLSVFWRGMGALDGEDGEEGTVFLFKFFFWDCLRFFFFFLIFLRVFFSKGVNKLRSCKHQKKNEMKGWR